MAAKISVAFALVCLFITVVVLAFSGSLPGLPAHRSAPQAFEQTPITSPSAIKQSAALESGPVHSGNYAATSSESIPDMAQYADSQFGFSFWYPARWSISPIRVADPTLYGGGEIQKRLLVLDPIGQDAFYVDEVRTSGSITSPVDTGCAATFFLDSKSSRWLESTSRCDDTSTHAADVSSQTADGLPIFRGSYRFDTEAVVPISQKNFIVLTYIGSLSYDQRLSPVVMARTVTVLPGPITPQEQQAVQDEARAYIR